VDSCFILVAPFSEYQDKGYSLQYRHKLLLKCAKNYDIWSMRLKDTSKNMHWPRFLGQSVAD